MQRKNKTYICVYGVFSTALFCCFNASAARDKSTKSLEKSGDLKISFQACNQIENQLGQLLYVNVDGNGERSKAISPAYVEMVNDLQIGGVLPHFNTGDYKAQLKATMDLQKASKKPLMIGVDYNSIEAGGGTYTHPMTYGMGFGAGFLKAVGYASDKCMAAVAYLDAFLHRAVGLNQSLGPTIEKGSKDHGFLNRDSSQVMPKVEQTVDQFNRMGIATTMKHYPYTPENFNLHNKSEDTKLSEEEVRQKLKIFEKASGKTSFAMSTHLYNSNIDPNDMATFSKKWVNILRKDIGFDGILVTDAIFMFRPYSETVKHMSSKWPQDQIQMDNIYSIFAARSILSGHDMVLLEGTSSDTYRIFNDLLKIACGNKPVSQELRTRINESVLRISKWKDQQSKVLKQNTPIPDSLIEEASAMHNPKTCPDETRFNKFKEQAETLEILALTKNKPASIEARSNDIQIKGTDN